MCVYDNPVLSRRWTEFRTRPALAFASELAALMTVLAQSSSSSSCGMNLTSTRGGGETGNVAPASTGIGRDGVWDRDGWPNVARAWCVERKRSAIGVNTGISPLDGEPNRKTSSAGETMFTTCPWDPNSRTTLSTVPARERFLEIINGATPPTSGFVCSSAGALLVAVVPKLAVDASGESVDIRDSMLAANPGDAIGIGIGRTGGRDGCGGVHSAGGVLAGDDFVGDIRSVKDRLLLNMI